MEYYFGTGLDTDYFKTLDLLDEYRDNLLNDDTDATTTQKADIANPSSTQAMSNLACDISDNTLFDVYLDSTKVMTAINTDYDWTLEIASISDGLISLRPQTTWGAFKSGSDSATAADLKIVGANDSSNGFLSAHNL